MGAGLPVAAAAAWQWTHSRRVGRQVIVQGHRISAWHSHRIRLLPAPADSGGWTVEVPYGAQVPLQVRGAEAVSLLRRALPALNEWGGTRQQVTEALSGATAAGSTDAVLRHAAEHLCGPDAYQPLGRTIRTWGKTPRHVLAGGHPVLRLAVEIAVNEDLERRALEGEMAALEAEWRDAEAIAAIADDLLLPATVRRRFHEILSRERVE